MCEKSGQNAIYRRALFLFVEYTASQRLLQIPKALEIPNILKKAEPIFTETHKLIRDTLQSIFKITRHMLFSV